MTGKDKLTEVSLLRIVKFAELELPFGSRVKTTMLNWLGEINSEPTHPMIQPVYRNILTPFVCRINDRR